MTKKDYELIAVAVKVNYDNALEYKGNNPTPEFVIATLTNTIAGVLQAENPRFNTEMFLKACGVTA